MQAGPMLCALLIAALTSGFAPLLPASGQAAPVSGVTVKSFSYSAAGPFKAGDRIVGTLIGTPSGKAAFAIPGVVERVPMAELSPGDYVGSYTVPKGISAVDGAAVGWLHFPELSSPLVAATRPLTIDSVPPVVTAACPSDGAIVGAQRPYIAASLADPGGVGVDPAAIHISLDSADVTARAKITAHTVGVAPLGPLAAGLHRVSVSAADKLGNTRTTSWSFTVTPTQPVANFSADVSAEHPALAGQTVRFTLGAQSGGRATVDIGSVAANVPLGEGKPGVYTGEYTAQRGDGAGDAPVWAEFRPERGKMLIIPLAYPILVDAGPPRPPIVTDPDTNDVEAGDSLSLAGTSRPNAVVLAAVRYRSAGLGGVFPVSGGAGAKRTTADSKGNWKIPKVPLDFASLLIPGQSAVFTISVSTVTNNGTESPSVTITARRN